MKNLLLAFALCLPLFSFSQNNAFYESHEVDSVAIPRGGYGYLTTFINANLQIPYMAKVAKVNGYVSLSGVVDEQGKISQIEVIKGIRPDCDREAIRIFGLFNAWQAALKGGKGVRQKVFVRVPFKNKEIIRFNDGIELGYLNNKFLKIEDSSSRKYVQKTKIDTLTGFPIGDIQFFEIKKNGKEKPYSVFSRKEEKIVNYLPVYPEPLQDSSIKRIRIKYVNAVSHVVGTSYVFWENGHLQQQRYYDNDKAYYPFTTYYPNGTVRDFTDYTDSTMKFYETKSWHQSGQIAKVIQYETPSAVYLMETGKKLRSFIINQWDDLGNQIVKNGEGTAIFQQYQNGIFTEKGVVKNFQKHGIWKGYYDESTVAYQEYFNNGELEKGISYEGIDSVFYKNTSENPAEYQTGMQGFAKHLMTTLRYPSDAQRANAQGRSYIQFVVCTDGSLCDYKVIKSAGWNTLDEEAIRVIKASDGKWNPGVQRGRKVRSRFTLPINFVLGR